MNQLILKFLIDVFLFGFGLLDEVVAKDKI